jgi:hypothetical protein
MPRRWNSYFDPGVFLLVGFDKIDGCPLFEPEESVEDYANGVRRTFMIRGQRRRFSEMFPARG